LDPHAPAGLSELAAGDVSACAAAAGDALAAESAPTLVGARVTAAAAAANCIATATATSGRVSAASTGRIAAVAAACGRDSAASAASVGFTSAAANAATAPAASPQFASGCRDADRRRLARLSSAGAKLQNGDFCLETATN
jgi:hypothetical protein